MIRAAFHRLDQRQALLTRFGLLLLALSIGTAALQLIDPRLIADQPAWAKPTRFFLSIGVFALTAAWFYGDVAEERRRGRMLSIAAIMLVVAGSYELLWISVQAARGLGSHFNITTPIDAGGYALMGVFAVLLIGTTLPLAWAIARTPRPDLPPHYRLAVVLGLLLSFILGGTVGGYMSAHGGHMVGPVGGALPPFGWNRSGGDLRVAHFLGLHAEQILPLAAIAIGAVVQRRREAAVVAAAVLLTAVTVAVLGQALAGRPFA